MQKDVRDQGEAPFFVRFLEGQPYPETQSDLHAGKGGPPNQTMKAPSDNDEW
jgi:hypothetical protein